VLEFHGRYYILDGYSHVRHRVSPRLTLSKIGTSGKGALACTLRLEPRDPLTQAPKTVRKFYAQLQQIVGQECNGGTMNAVARLRLAFEATPIRLLFRPWATTKEPYNSRGRVEAGLAEWSLRSFGNYQRYRTVQELYKSAESDLSKFYGEAFGYSIDQAASFARANMNWALRSHFTFPAGGNSGSIASADQLYKVFLEDPAKTLE
jgi:hypothetical protein